MYQTAWIAGKSYSCIFSVTLIYERRGVKFIVRISIKLLLWMVHYKEKETKEIAAHSVSLFEHEFLRMF